MKIKNGAIKGQLDGLSGRILSGWFVNFSRKESPVWIEIILENESLGVTCCNLLYEELERLKIRNGKCGFIFNLPEIALEYGGNLSIRLPNTDIYLVRDIDIKQLLQPEKTIKSQVFYNGGITLNGWAVDLKNLNKKLTIRFYHNNKLIGEKIADEAYTHDSNYPGHGFTYTLPIKYADGKEYLISVKTERGFNLSGSPCNVRILPTNFSQWLNFGLDGKSNFSKAKKQLAVEYAKHLEHRFPQVLSSELYDPWKEVLFSQKWLMVHHHEKLPLFQAGENIDLAKEIKKILKSSKNHFIWIEPNTEIYKPALSYLLNKFDESGAYLGYADGKLRFCPAYDPEYFYSYDYLGNVLIIKKQVLDEVVKEYGISENSTELRTLLILKAQELGSIAHLPLPIYEEKLEKDYSRKDSFAKERSKILENWFSKKGMAIEALPSPDNPSILKIKNPLKEEPLVSIIIPTRDKASVLKKCVESILNKSTYRKFEILIVDNDSTQSQTHKVLKAFSEKGCRILSYKGIFNFSAINNFAVEQAKGDIVCLLNNDTRLISEDWIQEALSLLLSDKKGIVGAKLIWPNGFVQHAGVIVGISGVAAHVGHQWRETEPGYLNSNLVTRHFSAVTAACLFTYKDLYLEAGGFDEVDLPVAFNDTDFCLKVIVKGYEVVWTPFVKLFHLESASRERDKSPFDRARAQREMEFFRKKWVSFEDSYYNPNLHLSPFFPPYHALSFNFTERRLRLWQRD